MTIERLVEIEMLANNDRALQTRWLLEIKELIADNRRLRTELNAIAGKAKEALDG